MGGTEKTVQMVLQLPAGRDWVWLPDCNIVVLGAHLDEAGRERAMSDMQAKWRRQFIQAAPSRSGTVRRAEDHLGHVQDGN